MKAPIACCLTTATLILVPAASFATPQIGAKHNGYSICEEQALHLYAEGMKNGLEFGRNRVEDGKLLSSGRVIPEPHPCQWRDYLDRQLHPPAPVVSAPVDTGSGYAPPPATSSGGLPACTYENPGQPTVVNPTSQAGGIHQIIPSTWAANGGEQYAPTADQATPQQQDEIAGNILNAAGGNASQDWVNC